MHFNIVESYERYRTVFENEDVEISVDEYPFGICLEIENKRILMVHGHNHNVNFSMFKLFLFGKENNCDLVLFGHTHKQFIEKRK